MTSPDILLDDGRSSVEIHRQYLSKEDAFELFEKCQVLKWTPIISIDPNKPDRYGYFCGSYPGLRQSNATLLSRQVMTIPIFDLKVRIQKQFNAFLDNTMVNDYRSVDNFITYHRDLGCDGPHDLVVTVSLGGSRSMKIQNIQNADIRYETVLDNGDLVIMSGRCQHEWYHAIDGGEGRRISITFRN